MIKKISIWVLFPILGVASIFYLFVVPALTATGQIELTWQSIAFGVFLYAQLWLLVLEYLYSVVASLYGFERKHLFMLSLMHTDASRLGLISERVLEEKASLSYVVFVAFIAWAFAIYGFAVAYSFAQTLDTDSFTQTGLTLLDFLYFSVVTAATVGYGDIAPKSAAAKIIVIAEIAFSYLYTVFILAILANEAAGRRKGHNDRNR